MNYITAFAGNFAVIFVSMALFFAPFVLAFWYINRIQIKQARPHFNYFMEQFFLSPYANWLVFSWAASEAFIWFIIPEFLLVLLVFMKIRRRFDLVAYDFAGTIVGTVVGLLWHMSNTQLLRLPYIRPGMITHVQHWYQTQGVWGLAHQPFSGVPYKVFTHLAPNYHFFWPAFFAIAILARMVRYLIIYEVAKALYPFVHRYVYKHYLLLFVGAIAVFTAMLLKVLGLYAV